jgi:lipopolysaccharide/colanic/teichoic acid biosynthesis glycosyltransferase
MDGASLTIADPSRSGGLGGRATPDASVGPDAIASMELAPAPPPPFALAALARYQRLERVVNVVVALVGLIIAAPLMLLIALAIKFTSKGPVLYRQPRVGLDRRGIRLHSRRRSDTRWHLWARFLALHDELRAEDLGGKVFLIYKFRTMCETAECATGAVWAVKNDPRSTRIGCFLRKYRLDELPQLFNVLVGEMNIVGPRPERPSIFARLAAEIEEYPQRQRTKPGITGWAQIHLKYDSCIDDVRNKVRLDLEYLRQKSLLHDLKIMVKTLPSVLFKRRGW